MYLVSKYIKVNSQVFMKITRYRNFIIRKTGIYKKIKKLHSPYRMVIKPCRKHFEIDDLVGMGRA